MSETTDCLLRVITGKLGSGKTIWCVQKMLDALSRGEIVVSNVLLKWPMVELYLKGLNITDVPKEHYRFIDTNELRDNPNALVDVLAPHTCLVIDEIHLIMAGRKWVENEKKGGDFLTFITQGRKLMVDVWLITQHEKNADAQLSRMATNIYRLLNWQHFPILGKLLPFPVTIALITGADGKRVIAKDFLWRNYKKAGACYDTHQTFVGIELKGKPARKLRRAAKRRMGYGLTMMMVGAVCVLFGRWMRTSKENADAEARDAFSVNEAAKKTAAASTAAAAAAPLIEPEPSGPPAVIEPGELPFYSAEEARRVRIESRLPIARKGINLSRISLENHPSLTKGCWFLDGRVTGWHDDGGGTVLVFLDSTRLPYVRLYYDKRIRDSVAAVYGSENRGARGLPRGGVGNDLEQDSPLAGVTPGGILSREMARNGVQGDEGPSGFQSAAPVYQAPPVYVPEMHGIPAVLPTNKWIGGARLGAGPAPASGFGFGPQAGRIGRP